MKTFDTRIISKHDTTANWSARRAFIPLKGEVIIYEDYKLENGSYIPGIKVGDGTTPAVDLPFVSQDIENDLLEHINNTQVHISSSDRAKWDNKLNCEYELETLIFNRE